MSRHRKSVALLETARDVLSSRTPSPHTACEVTTMRLLILSILLLTTACASTQLSGKTAGIACYSLAIAGSFAAIVAEVPDVSMFLPCELIPVEAVPVEAASR